MVVDIEWVYTVDMCSGGTEYLVWKWPYMDAIMLALPPEPAGRFGTTVEYNEDYCLGVL